MKHCNFCHQDFEPGPRALLDFPGTLAKPNGEQIPVLITVCDVCRGLIDKEAIKAHEQIQAREKARAKHQNN